MHFKRTWLLFVVYMLTLVVCGCQAGLLRRILLRGSLYDTQDWKPEYDGYGYQRVRKQKAPAIMCNPAEPPYDCGDQLMGVWLRLMKNPDYAD